MAGTEIAVFQRRLRPVVLLFFFVLALGNSTRGQIFSYEQNPPQLKWRQIQTPQFKLIYPDGFEGKAQQLAWQIDSLYQLVNTDLRSKSRKTTIILQNQSVLSNGFVQLAPRRSEFVTTPPPQGETMDWLQNLTVHELRHVAQFDKLVGNFNAPFLEQLGLAFYGISLPSWFFEGDAVRAETELTVGGRGRVPSWIMPYRTNVLNGREYSYQKDYLGSYRDVTPGFYELGFLMADKLERDFGPGTAPAILSKMSRNLLRPYNFSRTLRQHTGFSSRQWHAETLREMRATWEQQDVETYSVDYTVFPERENKGEIKRRDELPVDWLLPQAGRAGGSLLALRQGVRFAPEIVALDGTGVYQKTLIRIGWQVEPHFSARNGKIAWDEIRRNPRYSKQLFNVINTYDPATGRTRQLTSKTRLFSPAISPDGQQIVCVEVAEDNRVSVVLLDWESGSVLASIPLPDGLMLQTPSFDGAGRKIAAVAVSVQGTSIIELDLQTKEVSMLFDWQSQQLERPIYWGNYIVFKGHFDGIDNIYAVARPGEGSAESGGSTGTDGNPGSGGFIPIHQLTHVRFGAFNPAIDEETGELLFNNYVLGGHRISRIPLSAEGREAGPGQEFGLVHEARPTQEFRLERGAGPVQIPRGDLRGHLFSETEKTTPSFFQSRPYRETENLFNFHSLSMSSDNFSSLNEFKPGIFLLSDNLLNTSQTRFGYAYDGEQRTGEFNAEVTYQRLYPKFSVSYRNRGRTGTGRVVNRSDSTNTDHKLRWRENNINLDIQIPLVFYQFNHVYSLNLIAGTYLTQRYDLQVDPASPAIKQNFVGSVRFPAKVGLSVGHNVRRSPLDLAPRWGQNLSFIYRHYSSEEGNQGETNRLFTLRSTLYFPGIVRNHATTIRIGFQKGAGIYSSVNDIPMVSGFDYLDAEKINNTVLASYHLPLAYPDWEIGSLAYIKRIKGGLFADFQNLRPANRASLRPRTFGVELRTDLNLLRFYLPDFDLGARLIYDNDPAHRGRFLTTFSFGYSY